MTLNLKRNISKLNEKVIHYFKNTHIPASIAIAYFALITLLTAVFMKYNIGPDEVYHFELIRYYGTHSLNPLITEQTDYFWLKDLTREVSYLYHYLFSYLYRLLSWFGVNESMYVFLRLPNIAFTGLALYLFRILGKEMNLSKVAVNLSTIFFSGIPMFIILAASINYDNLLALESIITFILLMRIHKKSDKAMNYLYLIPLVAFSILTKFTYTPIAAAIGVYVLYQLVRRRTDIFNNFKRLIQQRRLLVFALLFTSVIGVFLVAERYAINIMEYGSLQVKCDQIHTVEQCLENGVFRRNYNIANDLTESEHRVGIVEYVVRWADVMNSRIYGMNIHIPFTTHPAILFTGSVFYVAMTGAMLVKMRLKQLRKYAPILLAVVVYATALILKNRSGYLWHSYLPLAVHGRYIFPVIIPVLLLGMHYVIDIFKQRKLRVGYIYAVIAFSIITGVPYMFYGFDLNEWLIF